MFADLAFDCGYQVAFLVTNHDMVVGLCSLKALIFLGTSKVTRLRQNRQV